ncbi:MAG: hypothetical protein AAFQ65_09460 [Myxococcota bacterium]
MQRLLFSLAASLVVIAHAGLTRAQGEADCIFAEPAVGDRLFGKTYGFRSYALSQKGSKMTEKAVSNDGQHFEIEHEGCDIVGVSLTVYLGGKGFKSTAAKRYFRQALSQLRKQSWNTDPKGELVVPIRYILQDLKKAAARSDLGPQFDAGDEVYQVSGTARASKKPGFQVEVELTYGLGAALL